MILETMLQSLRDRTHVLNKDAMLIAESNSAQSWAWNRLVTSNDNILKTDDFEATLAATTHSYNLATAVSSTLTLVAVKWLGVKLTGDTKFLPVIFIDSSDDRFISKDQDSTATTHPIYAAMENFNQVRFAPGLPSGAIVRCDYIYGPLDLDLNSNVTPDLPYLVHDASLDKATAQVFTTLDDDRAGYWEMQALSKLLSASNAINRQQYQQQPRTRSSRRRHVWGI